MSKWCVSCNSTMYDIVQASKKHRYIYLKKNAGLKLNDVVYVYVSKPYSKILFKTIVEVDDLNRDVLKEDEKYLRMAVSELKEGQYIKLGIVGEFVGEATQREDVLRNGLSTIQGPSRIKDEFENYLSNLENNDKEFVAR